MPAIYAHNKFGELVHNNLPDEISNIIKRFPLSFQIGLQGPDFLFFYRAFCKNKINKIGVKLHHNDIYPFIENAINVVKTAKAKNNDRTFSSQYSYILGFICHFVLDNACHPFVNEFMKKTGCGHVEIEGDFDRLIIAEEYDKPERFPIHKLVPTDSFTATSIAPFYENISVNTIHSSLKWMRRIKKLFVVPGVIKRSVINLILHATMHYKRLNGHIVMPNANPKCHKESQKLYKLMENAVPDAVNLINNFNNALEGGKLSDDFHKDFNGNEFL